MKHGPEPGAHFVGDATAESGDEQELVVQGGHGPAFGGIGAEDRHVGLLDFGQAAFLDLAQFREGASEEQVANAVERQPLGLEQSNAVEFSKKRMEIADISLSSIGWRRGPGRGGAFFLGIPLSRALSPLVPRGERKKTRARRKP